MKTPATPPLEVILGPTLGAVKDADGAENELRRLFAYPEQPWVRSNLVTTLDGAIHGPDTTSKSINNDADMRVFRVLRALADVIVVGARTSTGPSYQSIKLPEPLAQIRREANLPDVPKLAVVSRSGRLPLQVLDADSEPLIVTSQQAAEQEGLGARIAPQRLVIIGDEELDLSALPVALAHLGMGRVLTEGGPTLLSAMAAAGSLNEMALTITPILAGGPSGRLTSGQWLMNELSLELLLRSESTLLGLWRLATPPPLL